MTDVPRETLWLGLSELAAKPDASILLVDESSYPDAVPLFERGMAVVSWQGDPTELPTNAFTDRRIILWPSYPSIWSMEKLRKVAARLSPVATAIEFVQSQGPQDGKAPAAFAGRAHEAQAWAKSRLVPYRPVEPPRSLNGHDHIGPDDIRPSVERDNEYYIDNPEPINLFRQLVLPVLRHDMLPGALSAYVFDQSQVIGSDPGILAISCLVAAAGVANDATKLQPRRNDPTWTESARLWGAFVGDPSVKKTPAVKRAIAHVKRMDMDAGAQSAEALAAYRMAEKVHKKEEAKYVKRAANGEGGMVPSPPEKPPLRRILVEDTTVEALGVILADNPRGVLVVHDELAGFFGSMDAYRTGAHGKDRAAWLEAYNGGPKRIDRLTREPLLVRNWSVCVLGGIQPSAIRRIASDLAEDGLLQRFMVVMAQEQPTNGHDRQPILTVLNGYRDMLDQLHATEPPADPITLCDDGVALREQFDTDMRSIRGSDWLPIRFRYALGKWDGLFCRLTLTFHLIDCAYQRKHPGGQVPLETVERVNRFLREYLFQHTHAFYTEVLETASVMEHARWIAGHIMAKRLTGIQTRDLSRAYGRWNAMKPWEQRATLKLLEDASWLFPDMKNPGREVNTWTVNFRVHDMFEAIGAAEEARRAAARKQMAAMFTGPVVAQEQQQ